MNTSVESFGLIQAKLSTPYTQLVKNYINLDWDLVGFYYPGSSGIELVLYDAYTSSRIRTVSTIGELLVWESTLEVGTKKFYHQFPEENLYEKFASIIVSQSEPIEETMESIVLNNSYVPNIGSFLKEKIKKFKLRQSDETLYKRTANGIKCESLEETYECLHDKMFDVLKSLNKRMENIFNRKASFYQIPKTYPLINKFHQHIEINKKSRVSTFTIQCDELDLGTENFVHNISVHYICQKGEDKKLELKCSNFNIILPSSYTDLSFLDKKTLIELLKYIQACESTEFTNLESQIVNEIANRNFL